MSVLLVLLALATWGSTLALTCAVDDRHPVRRGIGNPALAVLVAGVLVGSALFVLAVVVQ